MLVLSRAEVESLLDLDALVEALAAAMGDLSAGRASMPRRVSASVEAKDAILAAMPAFLPSVGALTTKVVSLFPHNRDQPTHHAVVACFDPDTGVPVALMDGTYLTAARTAGGSALATRLLARRDAHVVCIVGTGVEARAHAHALARHPGVEMLRIAGRDGAKVDSLTGELAVALPFAVEAAASMEDGVRSADVVCATTHAAHPVVRRQWLRPGTHVNSVGYNPAGPGEVDGATIKDALVVVESRDAALAPPPAAGSVELRRAIDDGVITADHIHAELGEVVAGTRPGRTDDTQLTLYKSIGVAVQDAAAASLVLRAARERGIGTAIDL